MSFRLAAAALPVLLLVLSAAGAQEPQEAPRKYRLHEVDAAKGDVYVKESLGEMNMELQAKILGSDQVLPSIPMIYRDREKFTETVFALDKKGPSHLQRSYSAARTQSTGAPGEPPKTVTHPRQGKTVVFQRVKGKLRITATPGKLPAAEIKKLTEDFEKPSDRKFFPDHEVGPGDEWSIEGAEAARLFGGGAYEKVNVKARFEDVVSFRGRQCAKVQVSILVEGKSNGIPMQMTLEGPIHHALDLQRTLSAEMSGAVTMKATIEQKPATVELDGAGIAKFSWSSQWLKIAGKPVPAPKAAPVSPPVP
jgi:hypothetical protein